MAARKRRRKRVKKAASAKASTHHLSNLKRHEAILHAIRCSNDLDWVDEVRRVAGERYNTIAANRTQKALDDKWSEIKNTWTKGTYIVRTTKRHDRITNGLLYRVQGIRKIKKSVVIVCCDKHAAAGSQEFEVAWFVNCEVIAADSLTCPQQKSQIENRIFELSMTEIGSAFE